MQIALVNNSEGEMIEYEFNNQQGLYATDDSENRTLDRLDLEKNLKKMDKICKNILISHSFGYSYDDISTKLGIPVGTVASKINRCLQKLKDLF